MNKTQLTFCLAAALLVALMCGIFVGEKLDRAVLVTHSQVEYEYLENRNQRLIEILSSQLRSDTYEEVRESLLGIGFGDVLVESPNRIDVGEIGFLFEEGVFNGLE
ncbi:MAG: hypothetical protein AAGA96_06730 [Verrucomicrobiota bacterium]